MQKKSVINLGIAGAGKMASWHLKAYEKIPGANIIAICNPSSDKGINLAKKHGIKNYFRSYDEMLRQCESLDAVDICTPTGLHKEMIIKALEKGLHVYAEKPMCRSLKEADDIIQANKLYKRIIFNGFNYRFWPEILKIKKILKSGELGSVRFVKFVRTLKAPAPYMFDPALGGGVFNEVSCHFIDLMYWWGFPCPKKVCSHGTNLLDGRINPDTIAVNLEYENGLQVLIVNSLGIAGIYPEIEIAGTKGALKLKYGKIFMDQKPSYTLLESIIAAFRESIFIPRIFYNPFSGSCRYFIDCILGNSINESDEAAAERVLKITSLANVSYRNKAAVATKESYIEKP